MTGEWIPVTDRYPEMLGPGLQSAPVFCWVVGFWCPYAVMTHWQSTAPNQPHKWYIDKTFYAMPERHPYHYPEFEFGGEVVCWMPLPEPPAQFVQLYLELEKKI